MTKQEISLELTELEDIYRDEFGADPIYPNGFAQDADNIELIIQALNDGKPLVSGPPEFADQ